MLMTGKTRKILLRKIFLQMILDHSLNKDFCLGLQEHKYLENDPKSLFPKVKKKYYNYLLYEEDLYNTVIRY